MSILELIKNDHNKIRNYLNQLINRPIDKNLFIEFEQELLLHNKTEEEVFYNKLQNKLGKLTIIADLSEDEHKLVENLISYINITEFKPEECNIIIPILKATIDSHIEKEEKNILPLAEKTFTEQELELMGNEFLKQKEIYNYSSRKPQIHIKANSTNDLNAAKEIVVKAQEDA